MRVLDAMTTYITDERLAGPIRVNAPELVHATAITPMVCQALEVQ